MMKQRKHSIRLLFILALFAAWQPAEAQKYPVHITTQLIPPYSLHLSDYVAPGANRISCNLLLNDLTVPDYRVKLVLTIEGEGIRIQTHPTFNPPVTLYGGSPCFLQPANWLPILT